MNRTSRNDKNTHRKRTSAGREHTPKQQNGGFQVFNLKEVRAEEKEVEQRARALEREQEERKAEALKRKLEQMESSYNKNLEAVRKTSERPAFLEKAAMVSAPVKKKRPRPVAEAAPVAEMPVKKKRPRPAADITPVIEPLKEKKPRTAAVKPEFKPTTTFVPPVAEASESVYRRDFLDKTVDSSRNFTSVHTVAQKIHGENNTKRPAPKAELQDMDKFWAELEAAKKREAEERRQREIERARRQELEKARAHEAVLARLREEEIAKRRKEEEERQRALELKRQNEEAAAKWRAEEAARVRAEADKMREIQIQKAREEEARRIQMEKVAKVREAQIHQVRMEEEEKIRENLARMMNEDDQHAQIESMLEQEVVRFEEEGALLKEQEEAENNLTLENTEVEEEPINKEPDTFEDFIFPDLPSMEEDDVSLDPEEETDENDDDMGEKIDPTSSPKSWVRAVIGKEMQEYVSDDDLFDPIEAEESLQGTEVNEDSDSEFFDSEDEEDSDADLYASEDESDTSLSDNEDYEVDWGENLDDEDEEADLDDEDVDDFEDEIVRPRQPKKTASKAFVLPSFGKIMDSERPRDSRRGRIQGVGDEEHFELVQPEIQEEITNVATEKIESEAANISTETADISDETNAVPNDTADITRETPDIVAETPDESEETPDIAAETPDASDEALDASDETLDDSDEALDDSDETPDDSDEALDDSDDIPEISQEQPTLKPEDPLASEVKSVYRRAVDHQYHYNRKLYDSVLGKIVAASLIGVMALNIVIPDRSTSVLENRELKQAPKFSLNSVADGSFTGNVEEWQGDQFVGRNVLRNIQIFLRWIGGDREENDVYFGKNGQLLEKIVKPDEALLQENIQALNAFAEKYPDRRYGMMLVPDAGTILTDQYPAFVEKRDQRGDFGRVKSILSETYQWVDVIGAMDTHPDDKLYYKTDHHWTSLGAYYGYENFCTTFGLESGNFTANTVTADFNGSLASMSGFCLGEKETIDVYTPEAQTKSLVSYVEDQRQTATLYDTEKLETKDQYALFMGGNYPLIDIKTTTDNDQVLMLVKDSFANCMIPFLTTQYKEIIVVDPRYYYGDAEEILLTYGVTDVLFLYSGNTFFADNNLQGFLV